MREAFLEVRHMRRISRYSLPAVMLVMLGSCGSAPTESKVFEVLSDFVLVGSGPAKILADGSVDRLYIVPHGIEALDRPRQVETGVQYVFHHRAPLENESFALKDLPDRLSRAGFRIVKAPQSPADLMALYEGGPLFSIVFSVGGREVLFFNQIDAKLRKIGQPWNGEDYILVFLPSQK